jgi:hypothetical protein
LGRKLAQRRDSVLFLNPWGLPDPPEIRKSAGTDRGVLLSAFQLDVNAIQVFRRNRVLGAWIVGWGIHG